MRGFAIPLNRFGDGEQDETVVDGMQAVAGGGDDEVIAGAAIPAGVGTGQPNPPVQYLQRGLAGTVVIVEAGARGQGNQERTRRVGLRSECSGVPVSWEVLPYRGSIVSSRLGPLMTGLTMR